MTLLASERSLLIRNKFRSVLQLRIQNRRQSEINADLGLKSTSSTKNKEKDKSEAPRPTDGGAGRHAKTPPGGVAPASVQGDTGTNAHKINCRSCSARLCFLAVLFHLIFQSYYKRAHFHVFFGHLTCLGQALVKIHRGSLTHFTPKDASAFHLPLGLSDDRLLSDSSSAGPPLNRGPLLIQSASASLPATEGSRAPGTCQSNSTAGAARPNGIFLISPPPPLLPKTAGPPSPAGSSSPTAAFNLGHLAPSRKPRDTKPKMKKLKYHQYIPPDQRGAASGPGEGGAKQKSPPTQPLGAANSHLLKQQQVFLQLQILQQQQQEQEQEQVGVLCSEPAAAAKRTPKDTNNAPKPELLPANLVDLKVSELRQQLRKRGLPVSGTKPALLQRLRPFQLPPSRATPASLRPPPTDPPGPLPGLSRSSTDSPGSGPDRRTYASDRRVLNGVPNVADGLSVSLSGERCGPLDAVFLAPACTASGTPSPSLPTSSSSPLRRGAAWRTEPAADSDGKERINCGAREAPPNTVQQSCARSLHPFLQQEPGCRRGDLERDPGTEVLFAQVLCSRPWPADTIGRDFELPLRITASPVQNSPGVHSLEEELQEAILKAQIEGGAKQKSPPTQPLGAANSHLLQQQQVFLQLQIPQQQQQEQQQEQVGVLRRPAAAAAKRTPKDTNNAPKPELLPANLVDLKVSELRQQLRKRGLPVSGTKPALLQRLRPFQLPPSRATSAPLCPPPTAPPGPLPGLSRSSADSPGSGPDRRTYASDRRVPNGVPNVADGLSVSLSGERCGPLDAVFLAPACTASGTPSPSLPTSSSSPPRRGAAWRTEPAADSDGKERINCGAREAPPNTVQQSCARSLHPFLQQEPGCRRGDLERDPGTEVLFAQVLCSRPWPADTIGRDFELPLRITASPVQNSPGVRSLEEELQEAILKAQMDPRQSIDDILDERSASVDSVHKSPPPSSPPPQADPSQKCQRHSEDSGFLPLCSSLLLELPPSPAASHAIPAPPAPLCASPPPHFSGKSRKRRAQAAFEAADILETLTSGLRLLTPPPPPPFAEADFSLDSDLNINRVLDLMIEQW
ncbi:LOW QUALITY PROTEIN: myocardin-related transcription factor A [Hippocampus zosterae]|uniref:LOW QUALITY PROTEIN: myocardin-related transcription factor A n=1 Tax=Hippocampus zosterae TaxID=109293 RepID=UPI00223E01DE|nr:LOW QUALITY PROTEIN: myocardin-related transcription factor A [Hippocampus zosterae]